MAFLTNATICTNKWMSTKINLDGHPIIVKEKNKDTAAWTLDNCNVAVIKYWKVSYSIHNILLS